MKPFRSLKVAYLVLSTLMVGTLVGCGEQTEADKQRAHERAQQRQADMQERELAKIHTGQSAQESAQRHQRNMAYIQADSDYYDYDEPRPMRPIAQGNYIDYRGNTAYGSWNQYGVWKWHDINSFHAMQSRRYIDHQIITGVRDRSYLTRALTRDTWESNHRGGWKETKIVVVNNISVNNKVISNSEYKSRDIESKQKADKWKTKKLAKTSSYAKGKTASSKTVSTGKTLNNSNTRSKNCPANTLLKNGKCKEKTCPKGTKLIKNKCTKVDKPKPVKPKTKTCPSTHKNVNNKCILKRIQYRSSTPPKTSTTKQSSYSKPSSYSKTPKCNSNQRLVNGKCKNK